MYWYSPPSPLPSPPPSSQSFSPTTQVSQESASMTGQFSLRMHTPGDSAESYSYQ